MPKAAYDKRVKQYNALVGVKKKTPVKVVKPVVKKVVVKKIFPKS